MTSTHFRNCHNALTIFSCLRTLRLIIRYPDKRFETTKSISTIARFVQIEIIWNCEIFAVQSVAGKRNIVSVFKSEKLHSGNTERHSSHEYLKAI